MKLILTVILFSFTLSTFAQEKENEKIAASAKVLDEFGAIKENIPRKLLQISQGIIVIPKLINAGLVVGGKRGKGIAMIKLNDSTWSNPLFVTITGGSIGFQVGVQSIDLILVVKTRSTLEQIGKGDFTLGGEASATVGPIGRNSSATTDTKFEAEIYSYSKSKGLFAGISINGSQLDVDDKANASFYGEPVSSNDVLSNSDMMSKPAAAQLNSALRRLYR